jgi:cell division transport system ATP-binding protein
VYCRGMMFSGALVRLQDVTVRYGGGPEVLKNVNFELHQGAFIYLTGPSGAGKTTLLKLISMSLMPAAGKVHVFGKDVSKNTLPQRAELRRRIGLVFQEFLLLDHLTIWQNVAAPLAITGRRQADYRQDVTELLKWVGLGDDMHKFPPELSTGQKQRVAIARAAMGKPELLLADEPTGSVDPQMARRLMRLFIELSRLGTTIILATHDRTLFDFYQLPRIELAGGGLNILG